MCEEKSPSTFHRSKNHFHFYGLSNDNRLQAKHFQFELRSIFRAIHKMYFLYVRFVCFWCDGFGVSIVRFNFRKLFWCTERHECAPEPMLLLWSISICFIVRALFSSLFLISVLLPLSFFSLSVWNRLFAWSHTLVSRFIRKREWFQRQSLRQFHEWSNTDRGKQISVQTMKPSAQWKKSAR